MARRILDTLLVIFVLCGLAIGRSPAAWAGERCSAEKGQRLIEQGRYAQAIREFGCLIEQAPTGVEGYRGRIEANLLAGRYADALQDYSRITAQVLPVNPNAMQIIFDGYAARLAANPQEIEALTGVTFARWWAFDYAQAIHILNKLVSLRPNDVYANLFRGSSRLLSGAAREKGVADIEKALSLAPQNAHVRFVVADAYTYGLPDPQRSLAEAQMALNLGLNTPRLQAILAAAHLALGNQQVAATHLKTHIEMVTSELLPANPLAAGASLSLALAPGRTYEVPLSVTAGEVVEILTGSKDFYDTIIVLLAADGTPVIGGDDYKAYFAGFAWTASGTGNFHLWVTSFEGVNSGEMTVTRK